MLSFSHTTFFSWFNMFFLNLLILTHSQSASADPSAPELAPTVVLNVPPEFQQDNLAAVIAGKSYSLNSPQLTLAASSKEVQVVLVSESGRILDQKKMLLSENCLDSLKIRIFEIGVSFVNSEMGQKASKSLILSNRDLKGYAIKLNYQPTFLGFFIEGRQMVSVKGGADDTNSSQRFAAVGVTSKLDRLDFKIGTSALFAPFRPDSFFRRRFHLDIGVAAGLGHYKSLISDGLVSISTQNKWAWSPSIQGGVNLLLGNSYWLRMGYEMLWEKLRLEKLDVAESNQLEIYNFEVSYAL